MQIFDLKINGQDVQWFENLTREGQIKFIYNRSKYSKEQIEKELESNNVDFKQLKQKEDVISSGVSKKVTKRNK